MRLGVIGKGRVHWENGLKRKEFQDSAVLLHSLLLCLNVSLLCSPRAENNSPDKDNCQSIDSFDLLLI